LADDQVAQVKQANDIVDVIGNYVTLRPAGGKFKGLCPFHDDHRPSFDVDPRFQNYRCWSCGKNGDVFTFIQEHERVDFREALELLARRAGITLEKKGESPQNRQRALMFEVVRWAAEQYHRCLLDSPLAEGARRYLGERHLSGETVRRFGLGYAPDEWDWLSRHAAAAGISSDLLVEVGLLAARQEGNGHYDRFRARVMFPIRNTRGQTVGFGGRVLPGTPAAERGPKYYNSADTPLFNKSELLYGLDQARQAGATAGYLAVVEGYTDVMMAHQSGVAQVVATMGTALGAKHVQNLRRVAPRVVLVFDADAGGQTGVDRALEIFVGQDVDLAIATLPEGLDPCDLLVQQGPEPFQAALAGAVDALDFKLNQVLANANGIEERRRAVDQVLSVIALTSAMPGQAGAIKQQLIVTRIAQRLALKEENVWARLKELRGQAQARARRGSETEDPAPVKRSAPAAPEERELLEILLADASLVAVAADEIRPEQIQHPGLRRLLQGLYDLLREGAPATYGQLRARLNEPALADKAFELQEIGSRSPDRALWLRQILAEFRRRRFLQPKQQEIKNQLHAAGDHGRALDLLRQLQNPN
jgi:DNA primase